MTEAPLPEMTTLETSARGSRGPRRIVWGLPARGWDGPKGELAIFGIFVLAAVVLTYPVVFTLDQATGLRGDYFNNIWNAWWMRTSIAEGSSPWWTDHLYYPEGISLKASIH